MAVYKHGTYGEFSASIGKPASSAGTVAVYVGTAPVNLVRGYATAGVVNEPVYLSSLSAVKRLMGYAADWAKFTLCEAFALHFDSEENVGPIVAINVLNPAIHKKSAETTKQLTFANGRATIDSTTIILDTLVLAEKVEGVDFSIDYDFTKGQVIIESLGDTEITGSVSCTFSEIDTTNIDKDDIVGGVTAAGVYTGLGCVSLVYQDLNIIPNLIAAPGWSDKKDVYSAMVKAAAKINGHWDAMAVVDIPLMDSNTAVDTIEKANTWKDTNGYTSERAKVCWPQGKDSSGRILHADCLAGAVFTPTRIVIGSGSLPSGTAPASLTAVITPVKSLTINKAQRTPDGKCVFGGVYSNKDVTKDFYFRELALYAKGVYLNDDGSVKSETAETMYSYGNAGSTADLMRAYSTEHVVERQMDLVCWVGNTAQVNLTIASDVYVTREQIADLGGGLVVIPIGEDIPVAERKAGFLYFKEKNSVTLQVTQEIGLKFE